MRQALWRWVRSHYPDGQIPPRWALCVRALLFPVGFFYWHVGRRNGYQWESDTWLINGNRFRADDLRLMATLPTGLYRVTRFENQLFFWRVIERPAGADEPTEQAMSDADVRKRCEELAAKTVKDMRAFSAKLTPPGISMIAVEAMVLESLQSAYADGQRDGMERAAGMLEREATTVLDEWEHDPDVPSTQHHRKDCKDKCDGYCLCQMTFVSVVNKIRQSAGDGK